MDEIFFILKVFIDPLFIVFLLLLLTLLVYIVTAKNRSGALILFLSLVLLYGASIFPVANYLCFYLEENYITNQPVMDKNIDAIIVLGGGTHDIDSLKNTFPTEISASRVAHAVEVYNKSNVKYFVCSGRSDGQLSEAEVMARLAEKLGVPKEKIRIDTKSKNTWENAIEANKIFVNKNINVGIVTSAFHMKRSEREFKKYFNNVFPLPANYFYSSGKEKSFTQYFPQTKYLYKTSIALKEIVAQLWYSVKGI
jgi:uncharacterized SAM-binding protein YcdF (DUF218 family)